MATVAEDLQVSKYLALELAELHNHPENVRADVGDVAEMAASIREVGLLEPLVVAPRAEGGYWIIAGHRRAAAATEADLERVDCVVRTDVETPEDAVALMLIENLQRQDLDAIEEAHAFEKLVGLGLSQRELATKIGVSPATVSKRLSLLALPAGAQKRLVSGGITVREAEALTKLDPRAISDVLKASSASDREYRIRRHEREAEQAAEQAKRRKELEATGVVVLDEWPDDSALDLREVADELVFAKVLKEPETEAFTKAHVTEPCHAVILTRYGYEREICVEPARHGVIDDDRDPAELSETDRVEPERREAERTKKDEAREQARGERYGFYRRLMDGPLPDDLLEQLVRQVVDDPYDYGFLGELGCQLLGWSYEEVAEADDITDRLVDGKTVGRYGLALVLESGESRIGGTSDWARPRARSFLTWLQSLGYAPSTTELELVADLDADPAADEPSSASGAVTAEDQDEGAGGDDQDEQ